MDIEAGNRRGTRILLRRPPFPTEHAAAEGTLPAARSPMKEGAVMKVNIEIDCTPVEARQFFGLPDVEPLQAAVMERVHKEMLAEMDRLSPEAIMRTWLSLMPLEPSRCRSCSPRCSRKGLAGRRSRVRASTRTAFIFPQPDALNGA
jgi:uncharacterized protein DUF6489